MNKKILTLGFVGLFAFGAAAFFYSFFTGASRSYIDPSDQKLVVQGKQIYKTLRGIGIQTIMATGDALTTATAVVKKLGMETVHGEVTPADKYALVEKYQGEGKIVAMAGDGSQSFPMPCGCER